MSTTPSPSSSPNCDLMSISPTNARSGDSLDMDHDRLAETNAYVRASLGFADGEDAAQGLDAHRARMGASLNVLAKPQEDEMDDDGKADDEDDDDDDHDYAGRPARFYGPYAHEGYDDQDEYAGSKTAGTQSYYSQELTTYTPPYQGAMVVPSSSTTTQATSTAIVEVTSTSTTTRGRVRNPYTGLSNQGATCYMNSLLQTMFMTPELRLGLYQWTVSAECGEDDSPEEDNLPFQLQKLFAKLQLSPLEAISTKALTKSFGWTGSDVFQQHDVQELCRVLFDAIERSFKGTTTETLVNDLYQGTLKDYVKCCSCGYESSRNDNFLDLSLVIRPFGSTHMMKSVDEAIEHFLKPELLSGDNQWMCDRCKAKQDAIKGLKFTKLPYLLSLQLKRFDYDFMTDSRIKLHERVAFPKYLNMNSYLASDDGNGVRGTIARKMSMERHELEGTSTDRVRRLSSMDESHAMNYADEQDEEKARDEETWLPTFSPSTMIDECGPYVYELYSVLIHSGSALGGHYYAYIKALEDGKWYDFNDSVVSEISESEVKKAWGGNGGALGGRVSYSTCAYMLMYRLVDREKNVNVIPESSIPEYLVERMREEEERLRRQELERIEMAKKVQLKFFTKAPDGRKFEKSVHVYKTATLSDALSCAYNTFAEMEGVYLPSMENVRLRAYNDYTGMLSDTYTGKDDLTLKDLSMYSGCQLFMEIKRDAAEPWEEYNPARLQLFIRRFVPSEDAAAAIASDPATPRWDAQYVQLDEQSTIGTLSEIVARKFDVTPGKLLRFIKKTPSTYTSTPVRVLNVGEGATTLRLRYDLHLVSGSDVYFEECDQPSDPSPAQAFFEREANMIEIHYTYRTQSKEIKDIVRIDRRETIRTLKDEISARIGLPVTKFKLLRGSHAGGIELKAIDSTLYKMSISNGHSVMVVEGIPLRTGEYMLRLILYQPKVAALKIKRPESPTHSDEAVDAVVAHDTTDNEFDLDEIQLRLSQEDAELVTIGGVVAHEEMLVEELRQRVWTTLCEKQVLNPVATTPAHVRLRDLRGTLLTRILVDSTKLHQAMATTLYEDKGLVAHILPEPETLPPSHRLLRVVFVDLERWRFCKRRQFEFYPPRDEDPESSYLPQEIAARLEMPVEQLHFHVSPYDSGTFDICELYRVTFTSWQECMTMLRSRGIELDTYQMVVFAVDASLTASDFADDERRRIQDFLAKKREEETRAERARYSSNWTYRKPREAALVIRTKSKSSEKGGAQKSDGPNGTPHANKATPTRRDARSGTANSDTDDEDLEFGKRDDFDVEMDIYS